MRSDISTVKLYSFHIRVLRGASHTEERKIHGAHHPVHLFVTLYLVLFARQAELHFLINECAKLLRLTAFSGPKVPNEMSPKDIFAAASRVSIPLLYVQYEKELQDWAKEWSLDCVNPAS